MTKPQRCPGCRRKILTVDEVIDHQDCIRDYREATGRERHPDERSER